jgi:hypothetical protein
MIAGRRVSVPDGTITDHVHRPARRQRDPDRGGQPQGPEPLAGCVGLDDLLAVALMLLLRANRYVFSL